MGILKKINITNFECFRNPINLELGDATFSIGKNNSGKSSVFRALSLFFGEIGFRKTHLNETLYRARKTGYNASEITVTFNLNAMNTVALKERLIKENNGSSFLEIKRKLTLSDLGNITDEFIILNEKYSLTNLPGDYKKLIDSIKLNYIHPQQGGELLRDAQVKLRNRLLDNWGRSTHMTREMNSLEEKWADYRSQANEYLSKMLTENIKNFWGTGEVSISLPKSIKDIITIGEIKFKMSDVYPEIPLTSQGTGVQQSLLYYASYVLDSDRTLSRNKEHHPIWLLEEPESFLHSEMIVKLSKDLTSSSWLDNLQLMVTTHSGILLASSLKNEADILWNLLVEHGLKSSFHPKGLDYNKVEEIGKIMGDPNFDTQFYSSLSKIFVEDSCATFASKLDSTGLNVIGVNGTPEIKRHIKAIEAINSISVGKVMSAKFIIDGDEGRNQLREYIVDEYLTEEKNGFKKYELPNGIIIVKLPENETAEDLFLGYDDYVNEQAHNVCEEDLRLKSSCEGHLCSVYTKLKGSYLTSPIESWDKVEKTIRKDHNAKHYFWKEVKNSNYDLNLEKIDVLKELVLD